MSTKLIYVPVWLLFALPLVAMGGETVDSTDRPKAEPVESETLLSEINQHIRQGWKEYGIRPSAPASQGEWVRRLYLDVLGRIPRVSELQRFKRLRGKDKREQLVKQLLYDDEYAAEFAGNWSTIWTNLLIGRGGGNERNSLINREGMQKYLRDAFARNRPYNAMVMDLLTADGQSKPGLEEFNGAVNFLAMKLGDKAIQATADSARLFLGKQVQCTQCHNHPFNEWKQNQFWELNAFFRQTTALRRFEAGSRDVDFVRLTDQDFGGEGGTPEDAEIYFEGRDATLQAAYPKFVDGQALPERSGLLEDVHRRKALAQYVVNSADMPRAIVNRMWQHFMGRGFTSPVDDMGPHNPPTHPELLDLMAAEFMANSYDMRLLMQWIVLSEPYSLSSQATKHNSSDDPTTGEPPRFSRYYMRQMRAEELYDSLLTATAADLNGERRKRERLRRKWLDQFVITFGNDEGLESTTFNGTITQALVLFNGELMKQALSVEQGSLLHRLSQSGKPYRQQVEWLTQAAVARSATKKEQNAARKLAAWRGSEREGLQDYWWAMLNSNEFILNH